MKKEHLIIGAYILGVFIAVFAIHKVMQKFGLIDDGTQANRDDLLAKDVTLNDKENKAIYGGVKTTKDASGNIKVSKKDVTDKLNKQFPSHSQWAKFIITIMQADGTFIDDEQAVISVMKQFTTNLEFKAFSTMFYKQTGKDLLGYISSFITSNNLMDIHNILGRLK
jgi:aminoglycoside phosphotransferase family enzyme